LSLRHESSEGMAVPYVEAKHPAVAVGQLRRCVSPPGATVLIVAVDRGPSGFVLNVVLEDGREINGVRQVLAPIGWEHLEAHLGDVLSEGADIASHVDSYREWKELAQAGKAGYWTCSPEQVFITVRKGAGG
jgi:hypothetical protein